MSDLDELELVRAAQHGAVECLGALLAHHRAGMLAVALGVLKQRADADDAVQEAQLIAMRRIGELRDPAAVGPWLRAIVRNVCRTHLRADRADLSVPVDRLAELALSTSDCDPEQAVDRQATRDWVWHALHELTPALRLVAMLRYFTAVTAYDQIAAVSGVPIGTVRSRLSQARAKLADALLATADLAHDDAAGLQRVHRREAQELLAAGPSGRYAEAIAQDWAPSVVTTWSNEVVSHGHDQLVRTMEQNIADGVVYRLADVVAGRDIVILETELISPAHDPFHCPPSAVWVEHRVGGRVSRLRLFHPPREGQPKANSR